MNSLAALFAHAKPPVAWTANRVWRIAQLSRLPVEVRNNECAVRRLLDFVQVTLLDCREFTASEHLVQFSNTRG